jgi:superfamily II DNA or RNA helicase
MGNGLRDSQQELKSRAYKALGDGKMSVAVSSPTGTGKGKKISHIAAQMAGQGKRVLVTAPRGEIVDDLRNRIRDAMSKRKHPGGLAAGTGLPVARVGAR